MQSMSAVRALPDPEKPKEPSHEWQIVQGVLCQSMNTLGELASLALIIDGLTSSLLEIRLAIALTRPWDDSAAQWPLVHLIEAGRQKHLEPNEAEWYFYEHGKEKAVAALYQATVDDKQFFDDFDKLLHHSKVSLIGRILRKVAPYWDQWVRKYEEPKSINISFFKISRRRKTAKTPAPQKRPVKRCNLEQLHEDEPPTTHSAVPASKRRRFKSPNEEGNTLIPDPAQLPDKSNTQALFHLQPPTAAVPGDTQCNNQTGPPPPSNDASLSIHMHTSAPQQHPQQFTKTNMFNIGQGENPANFSQARSRVTDFQFDNIDFLSVDVIHSERVTDFDFTNLDVDVTRSERVTDFHFNDLDIDFDDVNIGDMQHPTTIAGFPFDLDDSRQHQSKVDDLRFDNPGDSRLPFGKVLAPYTWFHIEGLGGDTSGTGTLSRPR